MNGKHWQWTWSRVYYVKAPPSFPFQSPLVPSGGALDNTVINVLVTTSTTTICAIRYIVKIYDNNYDDDDNWMGMGKGNEITPGVIAATILFT